jgi:hypothetical protein
MSNQRKIPINRINKFFSQEDFSLEIEMGREALEADGNFVVVLYKVDRENTVYDDTYGEAVKDGIAFFPPVELRVIPTLNEPENKSYNSNGSLRYLEDGKFRFQLYQAQLDELDTDIDYGDYIGYAVSETDVRYFTVANDGKKNYNNSNTIMGYKGTFRTIECVPSDPNEFRGI